MSKYFCMTCSTTTEDATSCGNEHCGTLPGYVVDRDMSKRPTVDCVSKAVEAHPNCGTDECCGQCDTADRPTQIFMLAEKVNGKLEVRGVDKDTAYLDEIHMEYPNAFILTLTVDGDKILAALPETKVIAVDLR